MKVTINTTDWTQYEKNLLHANVSAVLYDLGVNHEGISVVGSEVEVVNPSKAPGLTVKKLRDKFTAEELKREAARTLEVGIV